MNDLPSVSFYGVLIASIGGLSVLGFLLIVLTVIRAKWQVTDEAFIIGSMFGHTTIPLRSIKRVWSDHGVFGEKIGKRLQYTYLWMEILQPDNRVIRQNIASFSRRMFDWHKPANAKGLQAALFTLKEKVPQGVVEESAIEFAQQVMKI